jgi:hypothetical protein
MAEQQPTIQEQYNQALAELTAKQRDFVEQYLLCLNATEAARRAGYTHPNKQGPANLVKLGIQAAVSAGFALRAMPADEVLARLADMARGSADDFVTIYESPLHDVTGQPIIDKEGQPIVRYFPSLDLEKARERGMLHLIKKVSYTAHGPSVELYDAQAALALLAKHHALLVERLEHSGPGGKDLFPDFEKALEKTYADGDAPTTE